LLWLISINFTVCLKTIIEGAAGLIQYNERLNFYRLPGS
jgi:hypothetical protein